MIEFHRDGSSPDPSEGWVFVFGSNLKGIHGAGAAKEAQARFGARYGLGIGRSGHSYAIPTKDRNLRSLSIQQISVRIRDFVQYVKSHPGEKFWVTRVGCGLAGYRDSDIAPLFHGILEVPAQISLPYPWKNFLK